MGDALVTGDDSQRHGLSSVVKWVCYLASSVLENVSPNSCTDYLYVLDPCCGVTMTIVFTHNGAWLLVEFLQRFMISHKRMLAKPMEVHQGGSPRF